MIPDTLLSHLPHLRNWKWSRNRSHGLPCLTGSCGVRDLSRLWFSFRWEEADGPHHLELERAVSDAHCRVTVDGQQYDATAAVRLHTQFGQPSVSVEVRAEGRDTLRFDGEVNLEGLV